MKAVFLYNPLSGNPDNAAQRLEDVHRQLQRQGLEFHSVVVGSDQEALLVSKETVKQKRSLLIVMGGDGTVEAVAPSLIGSGTCLGILVGGTKNNIARSLGIPDDLEEACRLIALGRCQQVDAAQIQDSQGTRRYFLEFAAAGILAAVLEQRVGLDAMQLRAISTTLREFITYEQPRFHLMLDGNAQRSIETLTVVVSNTPMFGPHVHIAPQASLCDGLLDVTLFPGVSKLRLASYFAEVSGEGKSSVEGVEHLQARAITIQSDSDHPVIADDGMLAPGAVEIKVLPKALRVLANKA